MALAFTKAVNPVQSIVGMEKVKFIFGLVVLALAIMTGWQIASCELANIEFHEELRDIAAQGGAKIGLLSFRTDEELRDAVIHEAKRHDIQLESYTGDSGTHRHPASADHIPCGRLQIACEATWIFVHPPLPSVECEVNHGLTSRLTPFQSIYR